MPRRTFTELRKTNELACNLTELNASEAVERGFITHNDWLSHVNRYTYAWKLLTSSLKDTKTMLDVGMGKFALPHFLWRNKAHPVPEFQYWGIELRAKESWMPGENEHWQVPINVVRGDILLDDFTTVPSWPGEFELVVCFETFEHVPRELQQDFLNRLFKWTASGGTVLFSTPNAGVSDSTAENHVGPDGISRERTLDEKREMISTAGFQIVEEYGTFCGTSRLDEETRSLFKTDKEWAKVKRFLSHAMLTCVTAINVPERSNNVLQHLRKP